MEEVINVSKQLEEVRKLIAQQNGDTSIEKLQSKLANLIRSKFPTILKEQESFLVLGLTRYLSLSAGAKDTKDESKYLGLVLNCVPGSGKTWMLLRFAVLCCWLDWELFKLRKNVILVTYSASLKERNRKDLEDLFLEIPEFKNQVAAHNVHSFVLDFFFTPKEQDAITSIGPVNDECCVEIVRTRKQPLLLDGKREFLSQTSLLLIDESQDLSALYAETLNYIRTHTTRDSMIVLSGDTKQLVYKWKQAEFACLLEPWNYIKNVPQRFWITHHINTTRRFGSSIAEWLNTHLHPKWLEPFVSREWWERYGKKLVEYHGEGIQTCPEVQSESVDIYHISRPCFRGGGGGGGAGDVERKRQCESLLRLIENFGIENTLILASSWGGSEYSPTNKFIRQLEKMWREQEEAKEEKNKKKEEEKEEKEEKEFRGILSFADVDRILGDKYSKTKTLGSLFAPRRFPKQTIGTSKGLEEQLVIVFAGLTGYWLGKDNLSDEGVWAEFCKTVVALTRAKKKLVILHFDGDTWFPTVQLKIAIQSRKQEMKKKAKKPTKLKLKLQLQFPISTSSSSSKRKREEQHPSQVLHRHVKTYSAKEIFDFVPWNPHLFYKPIIITQFNDSTELQLDVLEPWTEEEETQNDKNALYQKGFLLERTLIFALQIYSYKFLNSNSNPGCSTAPAKAIRFPFEETQTLNQKREQCKKWLKSKATVKHKDKKIKDQEPPQVRYWKSWDKLLNVFTPLAIETLVHSFFCVKENASATEVKIQAGAWINLVRLSNALFALVQDDLRVWAKGTKQKDEELCKWVPIKYLQQAFRRTVDQLLQCAEASFPKGENEKEKEKELKFSLEFYPKRRKACTLPKIDLDVIAEPDFVMFTTSSVGICGYLRLGYPSSQWSALVGLFSATIWKQSFYLHGEKYRSAKQQHDEKISPTFCIWINPKWQTSCKITWNHEQQPAKKCWSLSSEVSLLSAFLENKILRMNEASTAAPPTSSLLKKKQKPKSSDIRSFFGSKEPLKKETSCTSSSPCLDLWFGSESVQDIRRSFSVSFHQP